MEMANTPDLKAPTVMDAVRRVLRDADPSNRQGTHGAAGASVEASSAAVASA